MKLSLGITPRDYSVSGGASYDADAQVYFTANTAITSDADKTAINDFYLGLKTDGIYTKIKAMYLPIWGSASSSKWNLVNPVDTNGAHRLTFATGWTFSSSGIKGNGTTSYCDTFLNANTVFGAGFGAVGTYINQALTVAARPIGLTVDFYILYQTTFTRAVNKNSTTITLNATETLDGFRVTSRTSSTNAFVMNKAGSFLTNSTIASANYGSLNVFLGASNTSGSASNYIDGRLSFAFISNGITQAEATNFRTRVNTLMTYFGINV
jgi:hypothetical protein